MNSGAGIIALDLGGTNMRVGVVSRDGNIAARARRATPYDGTAAEVIDTIAELTRGALDAYQSGVGREVVAMAAAVPATFRDNGGVLSKLPNMPMLEGIDIASQLNQRLGLPVVLTNDATAATYGEHWMGASQGADNVIGITLGTGVGGGLILDGRLYTGKDGTAGEIGHICVEPEGIKCGCGSCGCVEQYAAGRSLVRDAVAVGLVVDTPRQIFDMAINGDATAIAIFNRMGRYLGIAVAAVINMLNPDVIVIGGGVSNASPLFIEALRGEVTKRAFREPAERANILGARLGDDAGLLGAARIAFQKLG